jgi:Ca2+-binding RTX toxin-like protein
MTNYKPGDTLQGAGFSYTMQAGSGNTLIIGGFGNDTIFGGSGNNTLYGGGGNGNKVLTAGTGATEMYGGGPGDNVSPSTGTHTLFGGSGNDSLYGGDGVNIVPNATNTGLINAGGDGGDNGVNILIAGSGNSTLYSDAVGAHENTLIGSSGLDRLFAGGTSGDYLEAGSGVNSLYGGTGNDVFQVPFIPVGQQAATPDTLVGGFGLTTLLLKPVNNVMVKGQLTQQSLTTDSDMYLNTVTGTTNQFLATLKNLDTETLVGQVHFTMPSSVQRVALIGGSGDNVIAVDPSVHSGTFLFGGSHHNILTSGSGNDTLVGGGGTSILQGGSGNDVLYGGAVPAVYQQLINSLGTPATGGTSGATPSALMTWLRQQAAGHNILIAGSGNSQLYAGNGGDLMIGGNAHFNATSGQFVLDPGAGHDIFEGGNGNDLMIGGLGAGGDVMLAGTGNDVLIGGNGENILQGGTGSDVLIGGSLINILLSNSSASAISYLFGGSGLNFEFAGTGNDQLFDYSSPSDPFQASGWNQAQSLATQYHVALPPQTTSTVNAAQAYQNLLNAQNDLSAQFALLNTLVQHPTQTGTIASGSNKITNLFFMQQTGTTTLGSNTVTGLNTSNLIDGEIVTGPGIPAGTTLTIPLNSVGNPIPGEIVLSNVVTSAGTNSVKLTFSDPLIVAPTFETGNLTKGTSTVSGLALRLGVAGFTTLGSATITNLSGTAGLTVGDTVTGAGIPSGATILQIPDGHSIVLSKSATVTSTAAVSLSISCPLTIGQPVTGPGIPAGTTITSIVSGTSIRLSNSVTASATGATLSFGSLPFAGPVVNGAGIPSGDSIESIVSGSSVVLAQNAAKSATNVQLTFALTAQEEQEREALNNALQSIALAEAIELQHLGANAVTDFLQGGSGTDSLFSGANPAWMAGTNGHDSFYITPANDTAIAKGLDTIQGGTSATDSLTFLADGNIHMSYNSAQNADVVSVNGLAMPWVEGNNISTVGVQTLGGKDSVTIDSAKFGSFTSTIRVVDGGLKNNAKLQGSVTIDASAFTEQGIFLGGVGSDTIKIGVLAFGSLVQGGTGNHQHNELDVLGASGGEQAIAGINPTTNHEDLQVNSVYVGDQNFQKLVMVGGSGSNAFQSDGAISDTTLEGGSGTNALTAVGGTLKLIGGVGTNTFNLTGAGTYTVIGGTGTNIINAAGGTAGIAGGPGSNTYNLTAAGTYAITGGTGANNLVVQVQNSGDGVTLSQNGSTISVSANIGSSTNNLSATALNMTTVTADGSLAGNNNLNASGMSIGVTLVGFGSGNVLRGGAGNDTLMGGSGGDSLYAGNNSDRLYFSGDNSAYYGTGSNTLVYPAQPSDNIAVYQNGILVNGQVVFVPATTSAPEYSYVTGTYHPFAAINGIGTVEIQDGTGTATAHVAQQSEVPGTQYYAYASTASTLASWSSGTMIGRGIFHKTFFIPISVVGNNETVSYDDIGTGWITGASWSFTYSTAWPNNPNGVYLTVTGDYGTSEQVGNVNGSEKILVTVNGDAGTLAWNYNNAQYGAWNSLNLVVDPGINVAPNLTVVASGANGAVVNYPSSFTTGGASPQSSLTYSIPSGAQFPVGTTAVTVTATDGSGRTSTATFNVVVLPAPASAAVATPQAVLSSDQFEASLSEFLKQAAATPTFAGSSVPAIEQIGGLIARAQQDATILPPYTAFDQGVMTLVNHVLTSGQAQLSLVQQQIATLANLAASGQTTSAEAQTLLAFLNNIYFGKLPTAFGGSSVTGITPTSSGPVWFTCANGMLGSFTNGKTPVAVTLNNVPVQISSLVVGSNGTAWFVTTAGQIAFCPVGQTAAAADQLASLQVNAAGSTLAGVPIGVTVTALDAAGNVILDFPGTIQITSSDAQATLPNNYKFSSADQGSRSFPVTLNTTGSQTITVACGSISASVTVNVEFNFFGF